MKLRILLLCLVLLPTLAGAEIYKWKDKDGKVRYSDVPPPSNVQQESLYGKKIPKPKTAGALAPVDGDITEQLNRQKTSDKANSDAKGDPLSKEEAARKRASDAENKKKEDEAKQTELKQNQQNCKAAQANLKTHQDGGRLMKTNEKGEREYLSDQDIDQGKKAAQEEVSKYCDN